MRDDTPAHAHLPGRSLELKPASNTSECGGGEQVACASAYAALALLEQAVTFIESIDDASYSRASRLLPGGTIGKHFRHIVDHFAATLAPLRTPAQCECVVIDYDRRERNVPMETCRRTAVTEIKAVMDELARAHDGASEGIVTVRVMLSADGAERDFRSTLGRELAFASHHAVHHHAMIQVIAVELGLRSPDGFGKAPSTLKFERTMPGGCSR